MRFSCEAIIRPNCQKIDAEQRYDLFSVLGTADEFRKPCSILYRDDLEVWLKANTSALTARVAAWSPDEAENEDRIGVFSTIVADCLEAIDEAIKPSSQLTAKPRMTMVKPRLWDKTRSHVRTSPIAMPAAAKLELFELAYKHLRTCPENCGAFFYRSLRSFENKFEHSQIDIHVGTELNNYLLTGAQTQFHRAEIKSSTKLLANDPQRQNDRNLNPQTFLVFPTNSGSSIGAPILVLNNKGAKHIVALSGPLTTDHPADKGVAEYRLRGEEISVLVENELLVRTYRPEATCRTQRKLRGVKL